MFNSDKRTVITGVGPLSAIGTGKDQFWSGITKQKPRITEEEYLVDGKVWGDFCLHRISDFSLDGYDLPLAILNEISHWKEGIDQVDLNYLLLVTYLALSDSKFKWQDGNPKLGLILTHENPGINVFAERLFNESYDLLANNKLSKSEFFERGYRNFRKEVYDLQTFMYLYHVGKVFNIHSHTLFLNNACASGLYGIEMARLLIMSGHCDAVVVAAADHPDFFKYLWFKEAGVYAEDGIIKPFSSNANGLVFGDGGGAIVIEDYAHAMGRNAEIYAEYLGGSFKSESWKVVLPAIAETYYMDTILAALERCNLDKDLIDVVVPHGVGMKVADTYESDALYDIFGDSKCPRYTAFKPYIGHNLGGSTLLETIIAILMLKEQCVLPTLNLGRKSSRVKIELQTSFENMQADYFMKTATAFAGFDAAVIFKRFNS